MAKEKETSRISRSNKTIGEVFSLGNTIWVNINEAEAKTLKFTANMNYRDAKTKIRQLLGLGERISTKTGFKGELRNTIKEMTPEEIKKLLELAKKLKQ